MDYFQNISYTVSHVFLMLFLYLFITHRYSKPITKAICIASCVILNVTDLIKLNLYPTNDLIYLFVTIFQIIVTQYTGILIAKKRNAKVLFMGLSASNYVIIGSVFASILYIYTGYVLPALAGSIAIHTLLLYILYSNIRNIWLRQYEKEYTRGWWKLCLIPVFFYCSFSFVAFFPRTLYEDPQNIPGIIFFTITMLVSYVVVLQYIETEADQKNTYLKNVLFESYIKGLENQFYLVEQSEQNLKILRHDMRHFSSMISHLLDQKEYDEIRNTLSYINDVTDENKVVKYTNNLMVNTIISKMMARAASFAATVHLDIDVEKEIPVNNYEFSAVIANLFENALICVKNFEPEKRTIELKVHCSQKQLFIQTKNAFREKITFDTQTGLPKSKKGEDHGLGMQSMLAFSDKIDGTIDCFCENGVFQMILFARFDSAAM
ncbi:MAG: GHKL domain-containing protein [Eubacterium sp.]|nr:GHKL domain-containing protein [Eubacterium sp.]